MVVLTGEYDLQKLLQLHAGIVAGHKRLNDNRRSQIALEQIGKTVDGGLAVPIRSGSTHSIARNASAESSDRAVRTPSRQFQQRHTAPASSM